MCLVEIKNTLKPIISCTMSLKTTDQNNIYTLSPLIKKARENILEFLLLNHPLDCPICDQGGECDLQDQSLFFGNFKKRFYKFKRIVTDKNIGPIVKTVMTRCIHCTKCIRFASEVAGTNELGMFGRGVYSEIGTYVTKSFQSELSGNVIDLCPVGALTTKPYPFITRNWELKKKKIIDFNDGFGLNLNVYLKNKKIIKITPGLNSIKNITNWITDKARFSFEGLFTSERSFVNYFIEGNNQKHFIVTWTKVFEEITKFLYFYDHLNYHFFDNTTFFLIVIDDTISLENLCFLSILSKKFKFIKIKKSFNINFTTDIKSEFLLTHDNNNFSSFLKSDLCFLCGVNTRYEGSLLNLKLRKRHYKGNFHVICFSSFVNLTIFPLKFIGSNYKTFKMFLHGNNYFCQKFLSSYKPIFVIGSNFFRRNDAVETVIWFRYVKNIFERFTNSFVNLNFLHSSLNSAGINYINSIKQLKFQDLIYSNGFYFIEVRSSSNSIFKKMLELKLLNYNLKPISFINQKLFLEQNKGIQEKMSIKLKNYFSVYNYVNLPSSNYFEETSTFLNTEGLFRKNLKLFSNSQQTKESWKIFRFFFSILQTIKFSTELKNNITFYTTKKLVFKKFINLHYFPSLYLNCAKLTNSVKTCFYYYSTQFVYKKKKFKSFMTNLKLWINDFFVGGNDLYSKFSSIMVNCSQFTRNKQTNFFIN